MTIYTLFLDWQKLETECGDLTLPEEIVSAKCDRMREIEAQMMALPSTDARDFAAKMIVYSGYGAFAPEADSPVMAEALQLVGGRP